MENEKNINTKKVYKMIVLNGICPFPNVPITCDVGKDISKSALKEAKANNEDVLLAISMPNNKYNEIGVVTSISQVINGANNILKFVGKGEYKVRILKILQSSPYYEVEAEFAETITNDNETVKAIMNLVKEKFMEYVSQDQKINFEAAKLICDFTDANTFCDAVATVVLKDLDKKLDILNDLVTESRLEKLLNYCAQAVEQIYINKRIQERVKNNMDKSQKEYYLREQMKAISEELGDDVSEYQIYEDKIKALQVDEEIKEKFLKELNRLKKIPTQAPDNSIIRNYLDTILDLPWGTKTEDNKDLIVAQQILDNEHSGLDKVKKRIIEYLAVLQLTNQLNGQILCFVGPPGVGKTSIAKSIAKATNRNFVKMSLGGIKDEAEIRGHRKTYVGAMPGRIIANMRLAKSCNPLFLIDEIDKLGSDYKGDPSSAMLEVLDPEQNYAFRDNFLEIPYDLSQVMFIATANDMNGIPAPLLDRMEIIELSSYTASEKLQICKNHLIKKQTEKHGIKPEQLVISDEVIMSIIENYTHEAGVRNLERQVATICRKSAVIIVNEKVDKVEIKLEDLTNFLGVPRKTKTDKREKPEVGVVSGLYYTPLGGGILNIEVNDIEGKGDVKITGQIGDVMKESAQIAMSVVKSLAPNYNLNLETIKKQDIHIHIPEGAIKKDGPSAGIALTTVLVSEFSGFPIDNDLAMTGEITLKGTVLPIGGLKEKLFGAVRAGITKAIVPIQNKPDIEDLPKDITESLKIYYASSIEDVLKIALIQ